ncbi:MAG: hypothetical protein EXR55_04365 [Dehalococcoidia bacterium]|nr:hypothetical protein [Dehalococcoidia bacterium]
MIGRLSIAKAIPGRRAEVVRGYQALDTALRGYDGYIASCIFTDPDDPNEVGRLSFWRSTTEADHAARDNHIVALRSQIHVALQPGHVERIVEIASSVNLPSA